MQLKPNKGSVTVPSMQANLLRWERLWRSSGELRRSMPLVWTILLDEAVRADLFAFVTASLAKRRGKAMVVFTLEHFVDYFESKYHNLYHNPSKRGPKWSPDLAPKSAAAVELDPALVAATERVLSLMTDLKRESVEALSFMGKWGSKALGTSEASVDDLPALLPTRDARSVGAGAGAPSGGVGTGPSPAVRGAPPAGSGAPPKAGGGSGAGGGSSGGGSGENLKKRKPAAEVAPEHAQHLNEEKKPAPLPFLPFGPGRAGLRLPAVAAPAVAAPAVAAPAAAAPVAAAPAVAAPAAAAPVAAAPAVVVPPVPLEARYRVAGFGGAVGVPYTGPPRVVVPGGFVPPAPRYEGGGSSSGPSHDCVDDNDGPTPEVPPAAPKGPRMSRKTASAMLLALGFKLNTQRGNSYHDGHERRDIVVYRLRYVTLLMGLYPRVVKNQGALVEELLRRATDEPFTEDECKVLGVTLRTDAEGKQELPVVLIFHDESTFSASGHPTQQRYALIGERANGTRTKERGKGIMLSSFYTISHGTVFTDLFNHTLEGTWWSNDSMVAHTKEMLEAVAVSEVIA